MFPIISKPAIERRPESRSNSFEWKGQYKSTYNGSYQGETPDRFLRKRDIR